MSARQTTVSASPRARGSRARGARTLGKLTAALAALALLVAAAAEPAAAGPARFITEVCDSALPGGGTPPGSAKFTVDPGVHLAGANTCGSPGGSLSITETGPVEANYAFWSVTLPVTPGGSIGSYTVAAAACAPNQSTVAFAVERSWPTFSCSEEQRIFRGGGLFGDWIWLGCNGNGPACSAGTWIAAHYFAATEDDPNAPTVGGVGGSLLSGGQVRGHQTISAHLADKGGGLSEAAVLVNGVAVGAKHESCETAQAHNPDVLGTVAVSATPCPTSDQVEWTLDTQSYPFHDGTNLVAVCGYDFSTLNEPNEGCSETQRLDVDNSCTPSAVEGGEVLSAQFSKSNRETLTVGYGHEADVVGQLSNDAGEPVPGATLCVKMQTLGIAAQAADVGTVQTDASGRYSYSVPPGPDREVQIGYRHDAHQIAREVRYYAHVRPSLKLGPPALRNGQRVHLWGRLPGPRAGRRVVIIQANVPGSPRWITFRKATTSGRGSFVASYRFNSTTRRTRYRFRALVPRQAGYPWVEGHSRAVAVLVKP